MNSKVDFYFNKAKKWQDEINKLRLLVLACGLNEELKWGCPCYMRGKSNLVLIHTFKDYCALLFFKGALIDDQDGLLIQPTENVQSTRQLRFTSLLEVIERESIIKNYIAKAIKIEEAGLKVELKKHTEYTIPEEFQHKLNQIPELKKAFGLLTPGRQRAYLLHFSAPKQEKTRIARIEKYIPQILVGKGLND